MEAREPDKELMDKEKTKDYLRENEELERRIDEGFKMEKEIEKEYGGALTLEQNLNSSARALLRYCT